MDRKIRKKFGRSGGFKKKQKKVLRDIINNYEPPVSVRNNNNTLCNAIIVQKANFVPTLISGVDNRSNIVEDTPSDETPLQSVSDTSEITDVEEMIEENKCDYEKSNFQLAVASWAVDNNINHSQLKGLIHIVNAHMPLVSLPSDPRTLLSTVSNVTIKDGNYWHRGLNAALNAILRKCHSIAPSELLLKINTDGISISKSSGMECWPILCEIAELPAPPEVIGIYCGHGKPKILESYLRQFVDDLRHFLANGVVFMGRKYDVKLMCFIADSPARALLKNIMNFNGCHGCTKCEVVGKHSFVSKTTIFTQSNAANRTDESFRSKFDPDHHKGETPLADLPIDMVSQFPVGDELHLLHLGLMRKFLMGWRSGAFGMRTKWSNGMEREISLYLLSCNAFRPFEVHRSIRGFSELKRWKGTEYRTFLLYCSLTVLKNYLPKKHFDHYLLFYCSVAILGSEFLCPLMIDTAENMIQTFLNIFKVLYGIEHFSSNLHNLTHLVDEVRLFGILSKFSAYSFENKLQAIKKLVRSGSLPLQQIARRIMEQDRHHGYSIPEATIQTDTIQLRNRIKEITNSHHINELNKFGVDYVVYNELRTSEFRIVGGVQNANQWVLSCEKQVIRVNCIVRYAHTECCYVLGEELHEQLPYFETPIDSRAMLIYAAKKYFKKAKVYRIDNIACKMFCLPYCGSYDDTDADEEVARFDLVFVPLWHTLKK